MGCRVGDLVSVKVEQVRNWTPGELGPLIHAENRHERPEII
jgi:hypothetical protein